MGLVSAGRLTLRREREREREREWRRSAEVCSGRLAGWRLLLRDTRVDSAC
ncbi:MAG: hypothetical protein KTM48_01730 [Wolbachia endosymbiont of Pissodes strobi]|nr:hypothetical protein [Wolbachia endosymbiont of Pissodes strobi]